MNLSLFVCMYVCVRARALVYVCTHDRVEHNGRGYSHLLAIRVCAAGKGIVFKPFGLV